VTVALSISSVLLLALVVFFLVRKAGLKPAHAVVCLLLGFYLSSTSIAPSIKQASANFADMVSGIDFGDKPSP
jgi:predicted membrane metal-binding protein